MKVWKVITPKRLQPDAFRMEILNELRRVGAAMKHDYETTTQTWNHKPVFETKISLPQGTPGVEVSTDDEIYGYVNYGTRPHVILPKSGGPLVFRSDYTPKTAPRWIGSGAGGSSGDLVFAKAVNHPGTEARDFDKTLKEEWQPEFERAMQDAMDRAAAKCGHGV